MGEYVFIIDIALGCFIPVLVLFLYHRGLIPVSHLNFFIIGLLLGLTWEFPLLYAIHVDASWSIARLLRPFPMPYYVQALVHSFWDAGIFLVGVGLVRLLMGAQASRDAFRRFSLRALLILLFWGQAQEVLVEIIAISVGGWTFIPRAWNPTLFYFRGESITLIPQLIWLAAAILFYLLILLLAKLQRGNNSSNVTVAGA